MLRLVATSLGLGSAGPAFARLGPEALPAVRAITRGPKFHWFGYYDKLEFDPTGRYVLGMEVDFEHRSPRPDDVDQRRHGRPARRRPLDRAGREPGLELAAGLHAPVAARLEDAR